MTDQDRKELADWIDARFAEIHKNRSPGSRASRYRKLIEQISLRLRYPSAKALREEITRLIIEKERLRAEMGEPESPADREGEPVARKLLTGNLPGGIGETGGGNDIE